MIEDWGIVSDKKCDLGVGEYLRIAEGFGEVEVDRESGSVELKWLGGRVSLGSGDNFTGKGLFKGRSLLGVQKDLLTDNPGTNSDDIMREGFLEGRVGGIIKGGGNIMVFRCTPGERYLDGVIVNEKTDRFVQFVGILDSQPAEWKAVANLVFRGIEVL